MDNSQKGKTVYRIRILFEWLGCLLVWYLADWGLFNSFPQTHSLKAAWIPVIAIAFGFRPFVGRGIEKKSTTGGRKAKIILAAGNLALITIVPWIIVKLVLPTEFVQAVLFYITGWIPAVTLALATISVYLFYRSIRSKA